jgi:predicted nucleic acid-binding protein
MRNLLIDTNIVIDLLARREPGYDASARLFSLADRKQISLSVSSLTFANTNYMLVKLMASNEAKSILRKFKLLVNILPLDDKVLNLALNDADFADFEDGLQYFSAIENNQDIIITRNLKDFKNSIIPVMTAEMFLRTQEQAG